MNERFKKKETKKKIYQIVISSIIILLLAIIITLIDNCFPGIISMKDNSHKSEILTTIIKMTGFFLGFLITSITIKLQYLDKLILEHVEDFNKITNPGNSFRYNYLDETSIDDENERIQDESEDDDLKTKLSAVHLQFKNIAKYRKYHKFWMWYPIIYHLIVIICALITLAFLNNLSDTSTYVFILSTIVLLAFWVIILNVLFFKDFLDNSFLK